MAYLPRTERGDKVLAREPRSDDPIPRGLHFALFALRGPEWTGRDLNPGPQPRKGRALPAELPAHGEVRIRPTLLAARARRFGGPEV